MVTDTITQRAAELAEARGMEQCDALLCVLISELREQREALLLSLKEFVELYSGTRHMLGDTVRRKLERAEAAIAKAEGRTA